MKSNEEIRDIVKKKYGQIARGEASCCSPVETSCCGGKSGDKIINLSHGYEKADLEALPRNSELGLGCGNPLNLVDIQTGWKVLDLGSGAGVDVFLAAKKVGESGHVTGLDMTDDMLDKARTNAKEGGILNVDFQKGEIENMPFADNSFDLVISNCVINLVPDKANAYREIRRVLKSGGKFAIHDIAIRGEMPEETRKSAEAWAGCVAGALKIDEYLGIINNAGFSDVRIESTTEYDYAKTDDFALLSVGLVGEK